MSASLDLPALRKAVSGGAAAFRLTVRLEPVTPKVFPPTYEGGKYATEDRIIDKNSVPCVVLDSVPSQANRMEAALQELWEDGKIELPVTSTDMKSLGNPGILKLTSLQCPHRLADGILRDSYSGDPKNKTLFRKSEIGKELNDVSVGYATPLLQYAPHSLVFGMWDSTGPRGGGGPKFSRSITSEIIGVNVQIGAKTSSRIDPLNIRLASGVLFQKEGGGWTLDEKLANKDKAGKAIKLGEKGKPSEANHGNVMPSIEKGGFTMEYAEQVTVLSLPALRKLKFPIAVGVKSNPESDIAARTYLASLGLLSVVLAVDNGYDLRSRCVLRAKEALVWNLLGRPGEADKSFTLDKDAAILLYSESLRALKKCNLPIELKEVVMIPTEDLVTLAKRSMELSEGVE